MKHSFLKKNYQDTSKTINRNSHKNYKKEFEYLCAKHQASIAMQADELEIWGISGILDGILYHYKRFKNLEKRQSPGNTSYVQFCNTINEITAYFNRLGQMYACITATWFQKYITLDRLPALCPTILALIPYRHKYAAHRSLDRRRGESQSQHESLSNIFLYTGWHGKVDHLDMHIGYQVKISNKDRCKVLATYHPSPVQEIEHFTDNDEIFIDFVPFKHHKRVISEVFETLKQLFPQS